MTTQSSVAVLDVSGLHDHRIGSTTVWSDYWALTKPEITFLVAITTGAAFWIGTGATLAHFPWLALLQSLLGTILVAGGAATLNQLIEMPYDARMRRTARRPLASGRIAPSHALGFGVMLSVVGVAYLGISTNLLAALLAALTLLSYLFLYTPLKRITPLCTLVGAIPGAAPPLIGWAAARGHLDPAAWTLFLIVFLWQFAHFTPIAWIYRDDYMRVGYLILPSGGKRHRFVMWQTVAPAALLFLVGLMPTLGGLAGTIYFTGILILGGLFLLYSARFAIHPTTVAARQLLLVSILYLPAVFALLALDKK